MDQENRNELFVRDAASVRTEPRKPARPVLVDKSNLHTPKLTDDKVSRARPVSKSAPVLVSKSSSWLPTKALKVDGGAKDAAKRTRIASPKAAKSSKPAKSVMITAASLAKMLEYDTCIEEECAAETDEGKLFAFLEAEGRLDGKVLSLFARSRKIKSINMTPSYGGFVNSAGLVSAAKYSAIRCTTPLYSGFSALQALDFTNVAIGDDELRYLIRLDKLQALGLSGSAVSVKGIKYLAMHASFKQTIKCLKLCYLPHLDDTVFQHIRVFEKLQSLDLRGCAMLTLKGCLELVPEGQSAPRLQLRLPDQLHVRLCEVHQYYVELARAKPGLVLDPKDIGIAELSDDELKRQLRWHRQIYSDVHLNADEGPLRQRLVALLRLRRREEALYACAVGDWE